jgi:4-hydroxy-3-polyprenylbenzoate decarboxylase
MRFIVALTGASGALYALRLLEKLVAARHHVDVVMSEPACVSLAAETEIKMSASHIDLEKLCPGGSEFLTAHGPREIGASIASGSVHHDGMVVVPCSMGTLGRIAYGLSDNLISRAADVTLKEKRKLILVTREMPLSLIHLKNMVAVTEAGAQVFHACPHFYHRPETVEAVVDTVVDRVLDHLGVKSETKRWKENT